MISKSFSLRFLQCVSIVVCYAYISLIDAIKKCFLYYKEHFYKQSLKPFSRTNQIRLYNACNEVMYLDILGK